MVLDDLYSRERFLSQLDWILALELRYQNILQTGLVHVRYHPREIQNLTFDAADAARQLGEVLACLRKSFRATDLVMRDGLAFWILTPFTQLDPVLEKVRQVLHYGPENGLAIASSDLQIYLLRDHVQRSPGAPASAEQLLDYLRQQAPSLNLL